MTSISAERSRLANVGMTLRRREQWGARRSYTDARTVSEPATKQFVHITVTNPGNYSSFDRHAQAIEAIGISRFPNTGISYNRLYMAGTRNVYEAQPIGRRGAHTVNDFRRSTCSLSDCPSRGTSLSAPSWNLNYNARAYAYASNVGFSVPDHVLDDMARSMAADRLAGFVTRNATIHGHRCVSAKSCPGDRMWDRMHDLERRVNDYLEDTMAWNEVLEPTPTAARRFPDGYTKRAGKVLMHVLGLAYQGVFGKIAPNGWMKNRWPEMPDEGYSPRVYWRSGYGHARQAKEEAIANGKQLGKLAGEVAGLRNAVEQLAANAGQPVDMAAVQSAALAGAQEAMAELSITVTVEPAEEPDGSEPDPTDDEDTD